MGSFFGNISIENNNNYSIDNISERIAKILNNDGYILTDNEEFDRGIIIVKNNNWVTIYDSNVDAQDSNDLINLVKKLSKKINTKSIGLLIYHSESLIVAASLNGTELSILTDDDFDKDIFKKKKVNDDIWEHFFGQETKNYKMLIKKFDAENEEIILSGLAKHNNLDEDLIFRGYNYYLDEVEEGKYEECRLKFNLITKHPAFEKSTTKPLLINNHEKMLNFITNSFITEKNETGGVLTYCLVNQGSVIKGIKLILKGSLLETNSIEIKKAYTAVAHKEINPDECVNDNCSMIYIYKNLTISDGMPNYYSFNMKEDFPFQKKLMDDFSKTILDIWLYYKINLRKPGKLVLIIEALGSGEELYNYCLNVNERGEQITFNGKNKAGLFVIK